MAPKTTKSTNQNPTTKSTKKTTKKSEQETSPVVVEETTPVVVEETPVVVEVPVKTTKTSRTKSTKTVPKEESVVKTTKSKSSKTVPTEEKPSKEEKPPKSDSKDTFKVVEVVETEPSPETPYSEDSSSKNGGRYVGTPMQAGKKAFGKLARQMYGKDGTCTIRFTIQKCTQGGDKKKYSYVGKRVKLETPQVINRAGSEYYVSFKNDVKTDKTAKV